ncbi:hypothetical protein MLD38_025673 [Melastoma candidum]|uniref:Uncharacterized protein n=1 Tax=Melastoma candidum TaxID=119954 RepID=A0ACB9NYZ8_9MYRT|nr:hypothetical protein MLD38_025673 [Melastoma candidum]
MRRRSLLLDSSSPLAPSLPSAENLTFLNLPPPLLPPDPSPSCMEYCLQSCFDSISPFDLCCEIEQFPIDSILSKILRDILPDFIEVEDEGFDAAPVGTRPGLGNRASKKKGEAHHENSVRGAEVPQFEIPELPICLENPQSVDQKAADIFFQVSEIENAEDANHPGFQLQCTFESRETMSLVVDSSLGHAIQSEATVQGDDDLADGNLAFPHLEVNEMSLSAFSIICMEDELEKFLPDVEPLPLTLKDDLATSNSLTFKEEYFLEYPCNQNQCLEFNLPSRENLYDGEFLSILEGSTFLIALANRDYILPGTLPILEEVQVLDVDCPLLVDILQSQKLLEFESCDEMLQEEVRLDRFQELIISQELAPVCNVFKSLHVPVLCDSSIMRPLSTIVEEVLMNLKACPPSASDGIYLDWRLLAKEGYEDGSVSFGQHMLEVIELRSIDSDWETMAAEKLTRDFIFGECSTNKSSEQGCKGPLGMLSDECSVFNDCLTGGSSCRPSNEPETERLASELNPNRASSLQKSMSTFDDLDFFLNPSKATTGNSPINAAKVHGETNIKVPPTCVSQAEVSGSEHQLGPWFIKIYPVKLSDEIVSIAEILKESYLSLLERDSRCKASHKSLSEATDSYSLLKVPNQVFMDCMKKANSENPDLIQCSEFVGVFATLGAIKQLAWYMCFYGLPPARLYIEKLCQLDGFKSRLSVLRHVMSSADGTSQGPDMSSHPSLSIIREVLLTNCNTTGGVKVLILADRIFWQCVKSLLTSMGSSFYELKICQVNGSSNVNMENLFNKDCLLASFEQMTSSFPFDKFGIILEYGVELEEWSSSSALCDGVSLPANTFDIMDDTSFRHTNECMDEGKLENLINFVPYEDKAVASSTKPFIVEPLPNQLESLLTESDCYQPKKVSFCKEAIVVNTQDSNDAMIVSRRSTYQKILALEKKGGIQVVERDSDLPVDIILSTSTCLVWYTCQNIGKKASGFTEGYSWLQSYVENIATNVLTLLSFSFSTCVLIFEGDIGFVSTVMESSDGLYAAAVGLGIHIQLFCSYSPELTDEIILNYISMEGKSKGGLCATLTESESLAESFLTKFPSINPLTANAILSSGAMLVDFLEWSNECRASALESYGVPHESISLFSALCQYGELEDSQSIMTDCSSSVSSGPDSKSCHNKFDSGRKQLYPENGDKVKARTNHSLLSQNLRFSIDKTGELPEMCKLPEIWEDMQIPTAPGLSDHAFDGLHHEIGQTSAQSSDIPANQNTLHGHNGVCHDHLGLFDNWDFTDWTDHECADVMLRERGGKVICQSNPVASGDGKFTSFSPEMSKVGTKYTINAHEFSIGEIECPTFPVEGALDFTTSLPNNVRDWQAMPGSMSDFLLSLQNHDDLPRNKNCRSMDINKGRFSERRFAASQEMPARKDTPNDRGTPLRSALSSPHLSKDSPWTVEFLNRIREKSKVRRQLLLPEASPDPDVAVHLSNPAKRRSPSILEFFKYRGGTITRAAEQKRQKTSSSGNRKLQASFVPTWTPIDKKSSRVLSFTTNGSRSQSKLVWSDGGSRHPGRSRSSML